MSTIYHALVLNLHQPAGNLEHLLEQNPWEAREILYALDRIPRSLWGCEDIGRVHLSLSGTLLETLANPDFQSRVYGIVDCGSLLWHLQNRRIIEILGTGYYHPVLPLIPEADRREHLSRWQGLARHLFWRVRFGGFWPPEMGFSMSLIPLIAGLGYRYVVVDSAYVEPLQPMRWEELRYRPHLARHDGAQIVVVVRDRELSDAQESGMEFGWFERELHDRTRWCDFPPLVITASDGENGGWFRNTTQQANFWGALHAPFMEAARSGLTNVRPCFIEDYLDRYGVYGEVTVRTGAWNTGWHHGHDFLQWTGTQAQKNLLQRFSAVSRRVHNHPGRSGTTDANGALLEQSLWRLLRAETSCNYYWGEAWVERAHADLDAALAALDRVPGGEA